MPLMLALLAGDFLGNEEKREKERRASVVASYSSAVQT